MSFLLAISSTNLDLADEILFTIPPHTVRPSFCVLPVLVQFGQPFDHMFARVDGLVLLRVVGCAAGRDGLNQRISVWVSKPCYGVPCGDNIRDVGAGLVERA